MPIRLPSTNVEAIAEHAVLRFRQWDNSSDRKTHRYLIALAGTPGSGKSTLAPLICAAMNKLLKRDLVTVIGMDGFHLTRAQLDRMPDPKLAHARRGAEWTFDPIAFGKLLERLKSDSGEVRAPGFDHAEKDPSPDEIRVAPQHRVVIVEGIYCLLNLPPWNNCVVPHFDLAMFIDCSPALAKTRVVPRHVAAGIVRTEKEAAERWDKSDGLNAELIVSKLNRDKVDVWIESVQQQQPRSKL